MNNRDYIDSYEPVDRIITDYYRFRNENGSEIVLDGVVNPIGLDNRDRCAPVDNQKNSPHCAGYSACTLVESLYWKMTGKIKQFDSHQVYALAKKLDGQIGIDGTYIEKALESVKTLCETDNDFSFMKNAKIGLFYNQKNQNTIETVKFLLKKYDILQGGFYIDEGWYDVSNTRFMINPRGMKLGGHAVNIVGYSPSGFYIMNQWGTNWGAKGFGIMPYDVFLDQFMYGGYLYGLSY